MTDPSIEQIKAVDPALHMPVGATSVCEATRKMILASSPDPATSRSRVRPAPRTRRRLALALASVLIFVVVPAAGAWAYLSYFSGPETVMDEFHAAQQDIALPAGIEWVEPDLPADAVYGSKTGLIAAVSQATSAWFREWAAAHAALDAEREAAASSAIEDLIAMTPVHREGDPEEAGGFDEGSIRYLNDIVERAKQGDFSGIEQYLGSNP